MFENIMMNSDALFYISIALFVTAIVLFIVAVKTLVKRKRKTKSVIIGVILVVFSVLLFLLARHFIIECVHLLIDDWPGNYGEWERDLVN